MGLLLRGTRYWEKGRDSCVVHAIGIVITAWYTLLGKGLLGHELQLGLEGNTINTREDTEL